MESIKLFHIIATIIFLFFGIIWTTKTWSNSLLKIIFFFMAVWGIVICLYDYGFIIKQ